jgi:hypothetical protein
LTTSAAVLALPSVLFWEHVTNTLCAFLGSGFARERTWIDVT